MFAILAEDRSDTKMLAEIVRRTFRRSNVPIVEKGFDGSGDMQNKVGRLIKVIRDEGATHFIICSDSDGKDPAAVRSRIKQAIQRTLDLGSLNQVIVVPVQAIEAWILADPAAVKAVVRSLEIPEITSPEMIANPKRQLISLSGKNRPRPLYMHVTHNPLVAKHLNISKVRAKCPSFDILVRFIETANP